MLIKGADNRSEDIAALKSLLKEPELTLEQRQAIKHELESFDRGAWGERDAAYFLNFHFSGPDNYLLLHDLKIVLSDERMAHIEHLLVNSFQDFFVLESVHWAQMKVDESGICTTGHDHIEVPSPLEKCERDAGILARAMQIDPHLKVLAPRAEILPRVLVAPRCILDAPAHDEWYVRGDIFHAQRAKESESMHFVKGILDFPRHVNHKTLVKIGHALQELHNPNKTNWRKRFGLPPPPGQLHLTPEELLASIEGLAEYVPRWGDDWFVLRFPPGKPPLELLKTLRGTGYDARKENGEWVWSIKVEPIDDEPTSHWIE